ncbi:hypothetical protein ACIBSW_24105 [Actinoplanes sp. NPDC049668]|uniref:hypothetical protein n=1 Tax=unclassified Actinoplanes TaxID=2626549 RepID=UPI0033A6F6E0
MTATGDPKRTLPAHAELERWYRRLLRAYPVGYRRAHGDEILATLMDCAEPGRRRPAPADVVDVARGAVRQWFRLPVGLSALAAAVLSALVLAAMGAAAGSWLAWQTTAELPSDSVALQTTGTSAGSPLTAPHVDRRDGWWVDGRTVQVTNNDLRGFPNWTLESAQARLQAEGWSIGGGEEFAGTRIGDAGSTHAIQVFVATRDGHILTVSAYTPVVPDGTGTTIATYITQAPPNWEPGAILLGWLLGAVTGWLLTGWASYRLRHRTLLLRAAAVVLGLAALWSAYDPTTDLYLALGNLAFADPGVVPTYPSYGSVMNHPRQVGLTLALAVTILAVAATGARRPARPTTAVA